MHFLFAFFSLVFSFHVLFSEVTVYRIGRGTLEEGGDQPILKLEGTPYKMGLQHGTLLKEKIRDCVRKWIDSDTLGANDRFKMLKENAAKLLTYVPSHYVEEMKGVAAGSDLPLEKIVMLNLLPDIFQCMGLTVQGEATVDKALYHGHLFDFATLRGLASDLIVMIVKKEGKCPFVSIGYPGLIGSVVGLNDRKISLGGVKGDESKEVDGMPIPFLIREILENTHSLEEAKTFLEDCPRSSEYCYVLTDGAQEKVLGAYATAHQLRWIHPGATYGLISSQKLSKKGNYGSHDKLFTEDFSFVHSPFQSRFYDDEGDLLALFNQQPKQCLIVQGFENSERYSLIADYVRSICEKCNLSHLQEAATQWGGHDKLVHSVIFRPSTLEFWVFHFDKKEELLPANYTPFDLKALLDM